jgi:hypothetical protein
MAAWARGVMAVWEWVAWEWVERAQAEWVQADWALQAAWAPEEEAAGRKKSELQKKAGVMPAFFHVNPCFADYDKAVVSFSSNQ